MVAALTCITGCAVRTHPLSAVGNDPSNLGADRISQEQARALAKSAVQKVYHGDLAVDEPVLEEISYWHVVIESTNGSCGRYLTNVLSATLSELQAKAVAMENSRVELDGTAIKVRHTELMQGPFWRVYVWRLPAAPDGYYVLDISPKDGAIVNRFMGSHTR